MRFSEMELARVGCASGGGVGWVGSGVRAQRAGAARTSIIRHGCMGVWLLRRAGGRAGVRSEAALCARSSRAGQGVRALPRACRQPGVA